LTEASGVAIGLIQDDPKTQSLAQILAPWAKYS